MLTAATTDAFEQQAQRKPINQTRAPTLYDVCRLSADAAADKNGAIKNITGFGTAELANH